MRLKHDTPQKLTGEKLLTCREFKCPDGSCIPGSRFEELAQLLHVSAEEVMKLQDVKNERVRRLLAVHDVEAAWNAYANRFVTMPENPAVPACAKNG